MLIHINGLDIADYLFTLGAEWILFTKKKEHRSLNSFSKIMRSENMTLLKIWDILFIPTKKVRQSGLKWFGKSIKDYWQGRHLAPLYADFYAVSYSNQLPTVFVNLCGLLLDEKFKTKLHSKEIFQNFLKNVSNVVWSGCLQKKQ